MVTVDMVIPVHPSEEITPAMVIYLSKMFLSLASRTSGILKSHHQLLSCSSGS